MSQKHQMKLKCVVRRVILIALAKLASSICTLKVTVTREVVIQPIGGLVPRNFNANIDASFIWNVNFSNFSWKSIPNSDQFGGKVRISDHFQNIWPNHQHCIPGQVGCSHPSPYGKITYAMLAKKCSCFSASFVYAYTCKFGLVL